MMTMIVPDDEEFAKTAGRGIAVNTGREVFVVPLEFFGVVYRDGMLHRVGRKRKRSFS
jgi:hypothetical protein